MTHLVREAFTSGLNTVLVVAAALGAAASLITVALVRVPKADARQQPEAGAIPGGQEPRADAAL